MSVAKAKDNTTEVQDPQEEQRAMLQISRALADPTRMDVLRAIINGDHCTCMDVRESLKMNPATLSHHMKQLEASGLISAERDRKYMRVHLRRKVWKSYIAWLKAFAA